MSTSIEPAIILGPTIPGWRAPATMRAQLSYRPREGIVSGIVAGRLVRAPTQRDHARVIALEKLQELRPGKVTLWDHTFESPQQHLERSKPLALTSPAEPADAQLTVVENAIFD